MMRNGHMKATGRSDNPELDYWDMERDERLMAAIREAVAAGVDAPAKMHEAERLYRELKRLPKEFGAGRILLDGGIRSEVDAMINLLKSATEEVRKGREPR